MKLKAAYTLPAGFLAISACSGVALAEDYSVVARQLAGQTHSVELICETMGGLSLDFVAVPPAEGEVTIYGRSDVPGWTELVQSCGAGTPKVLELKYELRDDGQLDLSFSRLLPSKASDTLTLPELAETVREELAPATTITGRPVLSSDSLDTVDLQLPNSRNHVLIFLREMPPRTTIEYLSTCFQTCEVVTFDLQPIEFDSGPTLMTYFFATGWSLPESESTAADEESRPETPDAEETQAPSGKSKGALSSR